VLHKRICLFLNSDDNYVLIFIHGESGVWFTFNAFHSLSCHAWRVSKIHSVFIAPRCLATSYNTDTLS
jgi:hypothetical protein